MKSKYKDYYLTNHKHFSLIIAAVFIIAMLGYIGFRYVASRAASNPPVGTGGDQVSCANIGGWAFDYDRGGDSIPVHIYFSKTLPAVSGRDPGAQVITNVYRPDVNAAYSTGWIPITGNHGFNYAIPNTLQGVQIRNSQPWYITVYAIGVDSAGNFDGISTLILNPVAISCPEVPPSVPSGLVAAAASSSQINLKWNASGAYTGSAIAGYDVYRNNAKIGSPSGTTFSDTGLAAGTAYSYFVKARDNTGGVSGASGTVSGKTSAATIPPKTTTPTPTNTKPSSSTKPTSPTGVSISTPSIQQVGDGSAPLGPASNLTASSNVIGVILNWTLSSGGSGEISYQIDRSIDNTNWENVASAAIGSTFVDTTAEYSTHYFYRVRSTDTSGGTSEYASVELTTDSFNPNVSPSNSQSFTSDDGLVEITIPLGALSQDAACSIVNQTASQSVESNKASSSLIAGPYLLVCKTGDDNLVQEFSNIITTKISVPNELSSQYSSIKLVADENNEGKFNEVESEYNADDKAFVYKTTKSTAFGLVGEKKKSYTKPIIISLIVLAIIALVIIIIKKKSTLIEWFYRR